MKTINSKRIEQNAKQFDLSFVWTFFKSENFITLHFILKISDFEVFTVEAAQIVGITNAATHAASHVPNAALQPAKAGMAAICDPIEYDWNKSKITIIAFNWSSPVHLVWFQMLPLQLRSMQPRVQRSLLETKMQINIIFY